MPWAPSSWGLHVSQVGALSSWGRHGAKSSLCSISAQGSQFRDKNCSNGASSGRIKRGFAATAVSTRKQQQGQLIIDGTCAPLKNATDSATYLRHAERAPRGRFCIWPCDTSLLLTHQQGGGCIVEAVSPLRRPLWAKLMLSLDFGH